MATTPSERVRLVFYDFGQAATLTTNQAEGILMIIDAIVEMDVDRSIEAFQQMGVLKEGAVLAKVRAKVADNYKVSCDVEKKRILTKTGLSARLSTFFTDRKDKN
jgi:predicted unusual protein kinase regulating ubiquinone biosynthesis (AarF/ABC1/UbiB family)